MRNDSRNLLVLFKHQFINEQEAECLTEIVLAAGSSAQFCKAHELVDRNRITHQKKKIVKESCRSRLRPFRFLINKN